MFKKLSKTMLAFAALMVVAVIGARAFSTVDVKYKNRKLLVKEVTEVIRESRQMEEIKGILKLTKDFHIKKILYELACNPQELNFKLFEVLVEDVTVLSAGEELFENNIYLNIHFTMWAAFKNEHYNYIEILLKNGVDLEKFVGNLIENLEKNKYRKECKKSLIRIADFIVGRVNNKKSGSFRKQVEKYCIEHL